VNWPWLLAVAVACALLVPLSAPGYVGGPLAHLGAWLNARAAEKTLRLLHAVAFWAAEPDGFE
jgi:hypothetical protein